ncbi:MAG: NADH:flavin oxidoreductase, partial [Pseudomonadota bacterium]
IMHAGPLSQSLDQPRGPSRFQPLRRMLPAYSEKQGPFPETTPITDGERRRAIDGLADAAVRGLEAGFDGIEIHAGNGYLLDSFLTHYTNQREDEYGGPTENRVRLIADAIQTVRTVIGPDRLLGVRLSQGKVNDFENKWPGGSTDGAIIFPTVAKSGADYIHFASQSVPYSVGAHTSAGESLTAQARRLTGLPVIANGQLDNAELAADVLARGEGDFISIGLGALLNPDWPKRVRDGRAILPFDPGVFSGGATVEAQFAWEAGRKAA